MCSDPPPSERRSWALRARGRLRARVFWRGVNCAALGPPGPSFSRGPDGPSPEAQGVVEAQHCPRLCAFVDREWK
eukprot:1860678-Lingulodinium_polyedra.AAC.1